LESVSLPHESVWARQADEKTISDTIKALKARGISAELVPDRASALMAVVRLIPEGAEVMTGASKTLEDIGFVDLLKSGSHSWKNLKEAIQEEADPSRQMELRKKATLSQYFLGSVHAVAKTGEVIIASAGGSQLAPYAYSADKVIWVVGTQKIVATPEDGMRRIREHSFSLEDARMKQLGYPGSAVGKILVVEKERPGRIHLIFVDKNIGF
jgi:L-lactate utilization protein LutC